MLSYCWLGRRKGGGPACGAQTRHRCRQPCARLPQYRCTAGNTPCCAQQSSILTHFAASHYNYTIARSRGGLAISFPSRLHPNPSPKTCVHHRSDLPASCNTPVRPSLGAGGCVAEAHWVPGGQWPAAMSGGNGDEALLGEGSRYRKARAIGVKGGVAHAGPLLVFRQPHRERRGIGARVEGL